MPVRVKLMREDDSLVEDKIVPLCRPHQVKGVVGAVKKMELRRLNDQYKEVVPPIVQNIRILTKTEVINALRAALGSAENFIFNSEKHPDTLRYVLDNESFDVRVLDDQD